MRDWLFALIAGALVVGIMLTGLLVFLFWKNYFGVKFP